LNYSRRYDEAILQLHKTLELDPNFKRANDNLYEAHANKGMYSEAVAAYLKGVASDGELSHAEGAKEAFGKGGWRGFLQYEADYLEKQPQAFPQDVAHLYARLRDNDKAFAWLEKAYKERSEGMAWLKVDPAYDPLRTDPRFADLMRRVGLPQ
jgi:tetratricopeptide (TPR) repeat protein